jgi:hypothetical protein
MKKILNEIREQPESIREIFMWVMVVITFSVIGFFTFRSTINRFAALVNPDAYKTNNTGVIVKDKEEKTPIDLIGESAGDIKANLSNILSGSAKETTTPVINNADPVPPVRLPMN